MVVTVLIGVDQNPFRCRLVKLPKFDGLPD